MNRAIFICACVAVALGVFFRIYALDRPLFWQDEVATSIRVTGHDTATYGHIFDGKVHSVAQIRAFAEVDTSKNVFDVMATMAREDPQHVPLYYMLERAAIGIVGTSASGMRALSVLCGIVAIGLAFVLGRMLAGARVGALAASLVALSPLFILMSRQSREYALFTDVSLLATIAFVSAMRRDRARDWIAYALAVVVGIYSDSLFALIAIGHGAAAVMLCQRNLRPVLAWLAAAIGAGATFVPWFVATAGRHDRVAGEEEWIKSTYSLLVLVEKLAFDFGAVIFDGEYAMLKLAVLAIVAIVGGGIAIGIGLRGARGYARWIPLAIALPTPLVLGCVDLFAHAHFVTVPRYLAGTWVGIELGIAVGIGIALDRARLRGFAFSLWVGLLLLGVASATMRGGAENWWDDGDGIAYRSIARVIDRESRPLVVSDLRWNTPLELSRYLDADASLLLLKFEGGVPRLPSGARAFVVAPAAGTLAALVPDRSSHATNVSPMTRSNLQSFSRAAHAGNAAHDVNRPDDALWFISPIDPK